MNETVPQTERVRRYAERITEAVEADRSRAAGYAVAAALIETNADLPGASDAERLDAIRDVLAAIDAALLGGDRR